MGGRASMLLVLGFCLIFMTMGTNFNKMTVKSIEGYGNYFNASMAYYIAVTGANMAANQIFVDKTWGAGYSNLSFNGGYLNVYINNTIAGTSGKVEICHIPPGNAGARHTLWIDASALSAHLAHGDYLGQCDSAVSSHQQTATIISEGTYSGVTKTIVVELRPSSYAKYGNYYSASSVSLGTGDTLSGPFHTNGTLYTNGTPVFWGKVTAKIGVVKSGSPADPKFYGGFESGINMPNNFDTTGLRNTASKIFRDTTGSGKPVDVRLYFNADGTVTSSFRIANGAFTTPKTMPLSSLAPNGLIYVEKGNIFTKGTLKGKVTLVTTQKNNAQYGKVYFEDNLKYSSNPVSNPSSTDMLGIVAESDIRIQDNATTEGKDIYTQGSMYSINGTVGPESGLVNQSYLGKWYILGGIIATNTMATATYSGSVPVKGLRLVHTYDTRFLNNVPPFFPNTNNFEIVSWYE